MPADFDPHPFEVDHIIAQSHGGPTAPDNLALACFYCNNFKGPNLSGIDPDTRQVAQLFNPRLQHWRRHFRYDGAVLVGRTAAGRATIATLRINANVRVAHRQRLIAECSFPVV